MIEWVVERVRASKKIDEVIVATDHPDIYNLVTGLGTTSIMTKSDIMSGTDRIFESIKMRAQENDIVINVQGDEPLIQHPILDQLITEMQERPQVKMATLVASIEHESDLDNLNCVKVILNDRSQAIYFSRLPIPYSRVSYHGVTSFICKKHIGIYGYRFEFLKKFCEIGPSPIEMAESLEQLRALQMGEAILAIETRFKSHGVDVPSDILTVEEYLREQGE
jgi:3-deoxy-manno-octulosonate cytidylyltransferase (CMP-KDO synthetase)